MIRNKQYFEDDWKNGKQERYDAKLTEKVKNMRKNYDLNKTKGVTGKILKHKGKIGAGAAGLAAVGSLAYGGSKIVNRKKD